MAVTQPLLIEIDWRWALGIIGSLLTLAWVGSGKFARIERDISWIKKVIAELKRSVISLDERVRRIEVKDINTDQTFFNNASPIKLTARGEKHFIASGLKRYIDDHQQELLRDCASQQHTNSYEVQEHVFRLFDTLEFTPEFDDAIKEYAYREGLPIEILRRAGAIYFRDICLQEFKMGTTKIDASK